tara:strand:+ start:251 stop:1039 length:789 start_codon:yes stop_codon:yes gene_type:complete
MDFRAIKGKKHYVFDNIDEFYKYFTNLYSMNPDNINIKDWRIANQLDWCVADDGGVVQILKKNTISHPNDRKNYKLSKGYVRTVVGTFLINDRTYMDTDFDQHNNRYTFSKTIGNKKNIKNRKFTTNKEKIFTSSVVAGHGAVKSYMDAFNEVDEKKAQKKAVILLKQERIMHEIEKGVLDVAKELGLDHRYILNKLMHLADYSEDDNIILQSTKELGKIIGTNGTTVKQSEMGVLGVFQGFSPDQLDTAQKGLLNAAEEEE